MASAERDPAATITCQRPRAAGGESDAGFVLHVVFPADLRRTFPVPRAEVCLGRDPGLDGLLLDDGTVSRRHATVAWQAGRHVLADLGSHNGSQVDGVRLSGAP